MAIARLRLRVDKCVQGFTRTRRSRILFWKQCGPIVNRVFVPDFSAFQHEVRKLHTKCRPPRLEEVCKRRNWKHLTFDGHRCLRNLFGFIGSLLFPMISFRCQLSVYPIQSVWTTPLHSALLRSSTTVVPGCIRGEPGRSSAHSTCCVPDRFPILAHPSMTMEPRTNMSTSKYSPCKEEL